MQTTYIQSGTNRSETLAALEATLCAQGHQSSCLPITEKTTPNDLILVGYSLQNGLNVTLDFTSEEINDEVGRLLLELVHDSQMNIDNDVFKADDDAQLHLVYHMPAPSDAIIEFV